MVSWPSDLYNGDSLYLERQSSYWNGAQYQPSWKYVSMSALAGIKLNVGVKMLDVWAHSNTVQYSSNTMKWPAWITGLGQVLLGYSQNDKHEYAKNIVFEY